MNRMDRIGFTGITPGRSLRHQLAVAVAQSAGMVCCQPAREGRARTPVRAAPANRRTITRQNRPLQTTSPIGCWILDVLCRNLLLADPPYVGLAGWVLINR